MAMTPGEFATALKSVHGTNLASVTLYGPGATGDRDRKWSDFNMLVVLRRADPDGLRRAARVVRRWQRAGNPAPVTMTESFLKRSVDVFPLEWLDMADAREVLAGRDVLSSLRILPTQLRSELEREMKVNLLRFNAAVQSIGWFGRRSRLRALLVRTVASYEVLLRGCLRLLKARPLPGKREAAAVLAKRWKFDHAPFAFAAKLRAGDRSAKWRDPWPQVKRLASSIETVVGRVDTHSRRGG